MHGYDDYANDVPLDESTTGPLEEWTTVVGPAAAAATNRTTPSG